MDGKALDYLAVKRLEKLPTKQELYATIARLLNQVRPAYAGPAAAAPRRAAAASSAWPCCASRPCPRQRALPAHVGPTLLTPLPPLPTAATRPHPPRQLPTKVARGINAVPSKVAYGVKALADGDDDKSKVVGDVFPKAA